MAGMEYTFSAFIDMACSTGDQHNIRVIHDCIGRVWASDEDIPEDLQRVIRQAVADMFNRASANMLVPPEFWDKLPFEDIMRLMACVDYGHLYALAEPMIVQKRNELLLEEIQSIQSQTGDSLEDRFLKIRKLLAEFKGQPYQVEGLKQLLEKIAQTLIGLQCPLLDAYTGTVEIEPFPFFEENTLHNAMLHQIKSRPTKECSIGIQALREHPQISSIKDISTFQVLLMQTPPDDQTALDNLCALFDAEKRKAEDLESPNKRRR